MGFLEEQEWFYYSRGIKNAVIKFENDTVYFKEKDLGNNKFGEYKPISCSTNQGDVPKFLIPLEIIFENKSALQEEKWFQDRVMISDSLSYEKYIDIEGLAYSQYLRGQVWAQRNNKIGPLDIITCNGNIICLLFSSGMGSEYLVKPGYEYLTPLKEWFAEKLSPSGRGYKKCSDHMVAMRDGIRLATEVWLPADYKKGERLPVIFTRTPYGKKRGAKLYMMYADRGYAVVLQDVRGREDSEGEFIGMYYEMEDGSDSLDWIAAQEWCNGNIGTIGGSYGGYVQWAAAASGNKHLKAIVSQVSAGTPFNDIERRGGAYHMGIMEWNIMMSEKTVKWDLNNIDWNKELSKRPIKDIPKNIIGRDLKFWDLYMEHKDYDEFWKQMSFSDFSKNIDVPALVISGWHDGDINGTVEIREMNERNKRENQRLLLGPWIHAFNSRRHIGDYELGNNAVLYNIDILYIKWFDRFLKGIDNGVEKVKVQYYVETQNKWHSSESWPPEKSDICSFYLKGDKLVNIGEANIDEAYREYIYDPKNPAPQLLDTETKKPFIPLDYSQIELRKDILTYTADPMEEDIIIAGRPKAVLYASSSALDTDWVVRLNRVTQDGKSYRIADQIIRAKYRNSFEVPELLVPNKIEKYTIYLPYCGQLIKKGEKIRLQVTSAQNGEIFPNSNTGKDPAYDTQTIIAKQRIYQGEKYKSRIEINLMHVE